MLNLAFGVQGLMGTLEGFKDGIDAADVLNLASQLALIGPALGPAIQGLNSFVGSLVKSTSASTGLSSAFNTNIIASKGAAAADTEEALATAAATTADLGEATASTAAGAADLGEAAATTTSTFAKVGDAAKQVAIGFATATFAMAKFAVTAIKSSLLWIGSILTKIGITGLFNKATIFATAMLTKLGITAGAQGGGLASLNFYAVGAGLAIGALGVAAGEASKSFSESLIGGDKETLSVEGPDGRAIQGRRGMSEDDANTVGTFSNVIGAATAFVVTFGAARSTWSRSNYFYCRLL